MASLLQSLAIFSVLLVYSTVILENAKADLGPQPSFVDIMRQEQQAGSLIPQKLQVNVKPTSWAKIAMTPGSPPRSPPRQQKQQDQYPSLPIYDVARSKSGGLGSPRADGGACSNDYRVDSLVLTVNWTPGLCATSTRVCATNQLPSFNIHGLWPAYGSDSQSYCCHQKVLASNDVDPSVWSGLKTSWRSVYHDNITYGTWQHVLHQWQKHGTCARDINGFRGANAYFQNTLRLFNNLQLIKTLEAHDIVPDANKFYKGSNIVQALKKVTNNKRVTLKCAPSLKNGKNKGKNTLYEIAICYDKNKEFIDCAGSHPVCLSDIMLN